MSPLLALLLLGLLGRGRASEGAAQVPLVLPDYDDRFVVKLSEDTWNTSVADGRLWVVMFHALWCEHSKTLVPVFADLAATFKDASEVVMGEVDCDQDWWWVCHNAKIQGYPTVKAFLRLHEVEEYRGPANTLPLLAAFVDGAIRKYYRPGGPGAAALGRDEL